MFTKRGARGLRSFSGQARRAVPRHFETLERRTLLNAAPVATNDVFTIPVGYSLSREAPALLANDTDADGNTLHIGTASAPTSGDLVWHADGSFEYTPDAGFIGVDSFTYQAHDGTTNSNVATVRIRVGEYAQAVLDNNPLGYWQFEEVNTSLAADSTGHGLNGHYVNVELGRPGAIAAEQGKAGEWGNGNNWLDLRRPPQISGLQSQFTIEAWVKPDVLTGFHRVFTSSQNGVDGWAFGLYNNYIIFTTSNIKDYVSAPVVTTPGAWYHIAAVFDGGFDASFYLNGSFVGKVDGNNPASPGSGEALIGDHYNGSQRFDGLIDEVALYDHTLSAADIQSHYQMATVASGKVPDLVDDAYAINAGETLTVTTPSLPKPRYSFSTAFDGLSLDPNLEDPNGAFQVAEGKLEQIDARRYTRTVKHDYLNGDFVYEVDVDMTTTEGRIMFVGIGGGGQANDEPTSSVHFRLHTVGFTGEIGVAVGNSSDTRWLGRITEPGVHRTRITKTGNQLLMEVDAHFNGTFAADLTYTIADLAATAPFLNATNSSLFFGGDLPGKYDNLYIESSLAPGALTGVFDNDLGITPNLAAEVASGPSHGALELHADGTFLYSPAAGYAGPDSFTYLVDDGRNVATPAVVHLTINGAPVAEVDSYTLSEDGLLDARGPLNLVAETGFNDASGINANPTANSPYHLGTAVIQQGANEPNWREGWNNTPASAMVVSNTVYEGDGALRIVPTSNTWRRWSAAQKGVVTVDQYMRFTPSSRTSIVIHDGQIGCRCETSGGPYFRMDSDGLVKVLDGVNIESTGIQWVPDQWYHVTVESDVEAQTWRMWLDGVEVPTPDPLQFFGVPSKLDAILYLNESPGNGALIDALRVTSGTGIDGVLANDSDPNGDSYTAQLVDDVAHGELDLRADGRFIYRPNANFSGVDHFTYRAWDGHAYSSAVTVTLNVLPVNDVPTVANDEYALSPDGTLSVGAAQGVLANDSDTDSSTLQSVLVDQADFGVVTLRADGSFDYVPNPGFAPIDKFTYRVGDGVGLSSIATVQLTRALPTIDVGSHELVANMSGQAVPIYVTGGLPISGLNLFVQVGDGGPERVQLGLPPGVNGPAITNVNVKQNTIFAGVPDNPNIEYVIPQVASASLSIAQVGGTVAAEGLLATITLDTTGLLAGIWDFKLIGVLPDLQGGPFNTDFAGVPIVITNGQLKITPATITKREIFYAGSAFSDQSASDKQPLLPGQTATFANYTSFVGGINGVAVEIANPLGTLQLSDFAFYVGNSNDTSTWQPAPAPAAFAWQAGGGSDGADRAVIRWTDGAIAGKWLMVRVKSTINTGLAATDVFYFGNAIGESGDNPANALVNATDVVGTRDNPHGPLNPAALNDPFDFNRDRLVNATDLVIARDHATSPLSALRLITPSGALPAAPPLRTVPGPRTRIEAATSFVEGSAATKLAAARHVRELAAFDAVFQTHEFAAPLALNRKLRNRQL